VLIDYTVSFPCLDMRVQNSASARPLHLLAQCQPDRENAASSSRASRAWACTLHREFIAIFAALVVPDDDDAHSYRCFPSLVTKGVRERGP
jgi:hypothetical protein